MHTILYMVLNLIKKLNIHWTQYVLIVLTKLIDVFKSSIIFNTSSGIIMIFNEN